MKVIESLVQIKAMGKDHKHQMTNNQARKGKK